MENKRFDPRLFASPPVGFYPNYAWIWNDGTDRPAIAEQLSEFAENGVRCFYILPMPSDFRSDSGMKTFFDIPYPGEEFFSLAEYAADIAEKLGMEMWLYDEGGWPSGGACGRVLEMYPNAVAKTVEATDSPGDIAPERLLAMFDANGSRVADADSAASGYAIKDNPHKNLVNLLDRKTADAFIECTYEGYRRHLGRHFGKTVRLIFTDEPRLRYPAWTDGLDRIFYEKYGYDILDFLPCVCGDAECVGDAEKQARIDYVNLCAELYEKNFLIPLHDFCRACGLPLGGHFDGENTPSKNVLGGHRCLTTSLLKLDVPGVDAIWRQIFPYSDGRAVNDEVTTAFYPRYASSAAHIGGKETALSETFSVYGTGMTPEDMRFAINYQHIRGINRFNFMSVTNGRSKALMYVMRPNFLPGGKPGWDGNLAVGLETARLCYLLSLGESTVHTALFFPGSDIAVGGSTAIAAAEAFDGLGKALEDANIEFDIIGADEINGGELCGGKLRIGSAVYDTLYIPECRHMPESTAKKLRAANVKRAVGGDRADFGGKLRLLTRKLDGERLVFVFNESNEDAEYTPKAKEGENVLLLDPSLPFAAGNVEKTVLPRGKTVAFLFTERELPSQDMTPIAQMTLTKPEVVSARRFVIENGCVGFQSIKASDFRFDSLSGGVTLSYRYSLPTEADGGTVLLEADIRDYSVGVSINGRRVGAMSAYPRRLCIPMSEIDKSGSIELTIENTEACEILLKIDGLLRDYSDTIGLYNDGGVTPNGNALLYEREYAARLCNPSLTDIALEVSILG